MSLDGSLQIYHRTYGTIFLKNAHISQSFDRKFSWNVPVYVLIQQSYNKGVHRKMKKEISYTFESRLN